MRCWARILPIDVLGDDVPYDAIPNTWLVQVRPRDPLALRYHRTAVHEWKNILKWQHVIYWAWQNLARGEAHASPLSTLDVHGVCNVPVRLGGHLVLAMGRLVSQYVTRDLDAPHVALGLSGPVAGIVRRLRGTVQAAAGGGGGGGGGGCRCNRMSRR